MSRRGFSDQTPKAPIWINDTKVKEIKVGTMIITTERVIMSEMGITTAITTSIGVTMVIEMIGVGPMFHLKIVKFLLGMVEVIWRELRICCKK